MYAPLRQRKNIFSRCMHLCDNGKIYFLDVCTPAATEKYIFLMYAPLRQRKKYIFLMYAPPRQRKKYIFLMYAPSRQRKNIFSRWMYPCSNGKMYSRCCKRKEGRTFF